MPPPRIDLVTPAQAVTIFGLFERRCERTPSAEAYRQYDEHAGRWRSYTWSETAEIVQKLASAWRAMGLLPGDRVAILLRNSVEWVCFDLAAQAQGLIVVPLYVNDSPGNIAHILADSGAQVLALGAASQWAPLASLRSRFPALRHIVSLANEVAEGIGPGLEWHAAATWLRGAVAGIERRIVDLTAVATLTYTSGTTGPPRGVKLTHANVLSNVAAVLAHVPSYPGDRYLSFLPLSHAFERTAGYYVPMMAGATVVFSRSVQDLADDLRRVRPTVLISVPRIYERAYGRMQQELQRRSRVVRHLVHETVRLGWRRFEAAQHRGDPLSPSAGLLEWCLRQTIARPIRSRFGGRVRVCVSGGAPLAPHLARWFIGMGLPLLQGYGLTEAGPVVSCNTEADNEPSSVGVPLPGVALRLGADGEVMVKSAGVMPGYWGRPEDTGRALDADGWLHTGDIGRVSRGRLYIVGRIKEILVLSTAEKVAPVDLETAITSDPLFEQALVVGEARPYLTALLVVDPGGWAELARRLGLPAEGDAALHTEAVATEALRRIAARLEAFPAHARVRKVWLTLEPWTIEAGQLTPTMKLKREVLMRQFEAQIEAQYPSAHRARQTS